MTRDLTRLTAGEFDLLVVGAGIYGAAIARDAAQRGLSVAIVDRGDFGGGTSFNSAKTVHGGMRALQRGRIDELRAFVRERRALSRILPHLVHPLPFLLPTYGSLQRSRVVMRAYFAVADLLARDRNALADPSKHLPPSRLVSRAECLRLNPAIDPAGVTGGVIWHDCQMYNSDRVVLAFLQSAVRDGAAAANYVEATRLVHDGTRVRGIEAADRLSGDRFDVRARLTVNAAGPSAGALLDPLLPGAARRLVPGLSKAMNLVTRPIATTHALGSAAGERLLLIAPWRNCSIVGTSHWPHEEAPGALHVSRQDVDRFLAEVNAAFPRAGLTAADVRLVHRGLLPAEGASGAHTTLVKASRIRDHGGDGAAGLVSVVGVRYTTARATAEETVDLACRLLGAGRRPSRTAVAPLAGGDIERFEPYLQAALARASSPGEATTMRRLVLTYGTEHEALRRALQADPARAEPLGTACAVTRGEILHAVREEMAVRLGDALLRRTEAGSAGHPGADAIERASAAMAAALGWSEARRRQEMEEVEGLYRLDP